MQPTVVVLLSITVPHDETKDVLAATTALSYNVDDFPRQRLLRSRLRPSHHLTRGMKVPDWFPRKTPCP